MSKSGRRRLAVVLFNLGGPDQLSSVRPFLRNLFADPAIISAPAIVRLPLAELISRARERSAQANYARMGGASPLLAETQAQAAKLELILSEQRPDLEIKVVIAMRYWRPFTHDAAKDVAAFAPDDVVLLPLYPQFSTTTTASSMKAWRKAYRGSGRVHGLCCWFDHQALVQAHVEAITGVWAQAGKPKVRVLFSAHGLPEQVVAGGDPYEWQVNRTCEAVQAALGPDWDCQVCYQSRVGPLKWLGPSTPEAIEAAAKDGVGVLVDPIAFVSDHIETLVELDHEYAELAASLGVGVYLRAPVAGCGDAFIAGLADAALGAMERSGCQPTGSACPAQFGRCGRQPATAS